MVINPISLGGNGLLPEIIVTAPSGSTLDLMQGSVVLQTYTLSSTETQHTFTVKNTGTYTVRGISGSDTANVEVVVDAIGQFSCTIEYFNGLKLYWYGDECEDVTGGWSYSGYNDTSVSTEFDAVKNTNNIQIDGKSGGSTFSGTQKKVDLSQYTTLKILVNCSNAANGTGFIDIYCVSDKTFYYPSLTNILTIRTLGIGTYTLDISSYNDMYVTMSCGGYPKQSLVYAVWLE